MSFSNFHCEDPHRESIESRVAPLLTIKTAVDTKLQTHQTTQISFFVVNNIKNYNSNPTRKKASPWNFVLFLSLFQWLLCLCLLYLWLIQGDQMLLLLLSVQVIWGFVQVLLGLVWQRRIKESLVWQRRIKESGSLFVELLLFLFVILMLMILDTLLINRFLFTGLFILEIPFSFFYLQSSNSWFFSPSEYTDFEGNSRIKWTGEGSVRYY